MAAFEAVSKLTIQPHEQTSFIDFRTATIPAGRLSINNYNPQEHRAPLQPIKLWMAYFNLFRTLFGAGVLGLPLAISQAGLSLGVLMAICTGVLITHTHLMLLRCLNEVSRQLQIPYISYRYGFRIALMHGPGACQWIGRFGPTIIATFMILSQIGICTVFVAFTTDSLRDLMDWTTSQPAILALLLPFLVLEFFMKTLKIVSYVSMLGNVLNLIGMILVTYFIFDDPHGELILHITEPLPLLFAFGTFLFNLSAVGVVLSIDKSLKNPKLLTKKYGVIVIGIMVPTIVATIFGGLGYWSFGTMEDNVLRTLPFDNDLAMAAIGLYLIAVALAYPIQCYPAIQIIIEVVKNMHSDPDDQPLESSLRIIETVARPIFVLTTFLICHFIPFQGPFVAFVGNLCTTFLALIFPALMNICLMYPGPYGKFYIYLIKDILIILLGITSFLFGVVLCGYLIYIRLLELRAPYETDYL